MRNLKRTLLTRICVPPHPCVCTCVCKVFDEVRATQDKFWLRKTFGRLVLVVKQRHAMSRYKRDRMRNFLRICSRLRLLYRIMPEYHAIRTKWRVWCSWLKYIEVAHKSPHMYTCRYMHLSSNMIQNKPLNSYQWWSLFKTKQTKQKDNLLLIWFLAQLFLRAFFSGQV